MTIVTPPPAINRDRYGRPLVIPPGGGKPVPYTRCTTYVKCIADTYNLQAWMQRMVAIGLASRPDLLLAVSAHRDDKRELDSICEKAREAAQASAAATTGTALHALTELVDRGEELPPLPPGPKASLEAYAAATADLTAVHIERFTVLDTLQIGGTPDRIVQLGDKRYIADIKSGNIEYGALEIAMQLAVYARSKLYDIPTGGRDLHAADPSRGLVIHLPATDNPAEARCELRWFDLEAGWYAVNVATQVREKRKLKFADLTEPYTGPLPYVRPDAPTAAGMPTNTGMTRRRAVEAAQKPDLPALIAAAPDADALRALWAAHESEWDDHLTELAKRRLTELPTVA